MSKAPSELSARFESVLAHYARLSKRLTNGPSDDWAVPAYAWTEAGSGIALTAIERCLWEEIRLANVIMYPQFPVGRFFVDFGNPAAKVAIECDGAAFHKDKAKDAARQHVIESLGWTVYRITGAACWVNPPEEYDEDGYLIDSISPGQALIQMIVARHPVRRHCLGRVSLGPQPMSAIIAKVFEDMRHG